MKRLLAWLTLMCCLLFFVPTVLAEPAEDAPLMEEDALTEEEAPAEEADPIPQAQAPVTQIPVEETVDPLSGETSIRSVRITCVVDGRGNATISQEVELSIVGGLTKIRFAFPASAKNRQVVGMRTRASAENGLRYLSVSNEMGFMGTQNFTLSYTLDGLVTGTKDSQKLDVPLLVAQDYRVGLVSLAVNLPQEFSSYPSFTSGYYGEIIEDYMTVETHPTAVTATVNGILQDSDSLTLHLTLPSDYFSGSFGQGFGDTFRTILIVLLLILAPVYWFRSLRNPRLRVQVRTLPPDGVNPGDLPYLLAGGDADFNMLISHWATLGYLSFYINKSGHVILRRRMSMGNERRNFERKLFDLLFRNSHTCDGASLHYKKVGQHAMTVIPRYWQRRLYDKTSGSPVLVRGLCALACGFATAAALDVLAPARGHGLFLLLGFISGFALCAMTVSVCGMIYLRNWKKLSMGCAACLLLLLVGGLGGASGLMLPCVAMSIFMGWQTIHGGRRNAYGAEVISQTLGFRRFLLHANAHHLSQMLRTDPQYFYKMLPYAEAMGQGRQFVSLFHDVQLEPCQWFEDRAGTPQTTEAFYTAYLDALELLNISLQK